MAHLGVVDDVVSLQGVELGRDLVDPGPVLFEEHGSAPVVEPSPHEAIVAQAKDQEVAWGLPFQDLGRDRDLTEGLLWGDVGGCVVGESLD